MSAKIQYCCNKSNCNLPKKREISGHSLDKLAQLGTKSDYGVISDADFEITGSTNKSDKTTLQKRARRKYFTVGLVLALVNASKKNPYSTLTTSYWRTYRCVSTLALFEDGKIVGDYCKCRWCMVCNAIRTANYINRYSPVLSSWTDSHLVTLTLPNCNRENLCSTIDSMQKCFSLIMNTQKKKFQRSKSSFKLVGIRKMECTYNSVRNDYHPHYHVIVEKKEMANVLLEEWLKRNPTANIKAQDVRKADSGAVQELFKYMTKVIASGGKNGKIDRRIFAAPLDVIFNAMVRRRVVQPFGFRLPKSLEEPSEETDVNTLLGIMSWQQDIADWVDYETGETLSGYVPNEGMKDLVNNRIHVGKA